MRRLSLMVTEPLFEQIELARGDVPRERWLRRAVERALGESRVILSSEDVGVSPAPAEQPEKSERQRDLEARIDKAASSMGPGPLRDLVRPVREFRPYPKGGKR